MLLQRADCEYAKMFSKLAVLAATQFLSALAVDISVGSSGGNATSGHQYGFLHEVSSQRANRPNKTNRHSCRML